jgi:hypothetical protein
MKQEQEAKIFGFILAVEGYLADMAERGDFAARVLRDMAGDILDRLEGED